MDTFIDVTVDDLMEIQSRARNHAQVRSKENLQVRDLMSTPVRSIAPDTALAEAAHLLVTLRISSLPVVDAQQQLIGIITEADFLRAIGIPSHQPSHNLWQTLEAMFAHNIETSDPQGNVASLMSKDVITVEPEQNLHQVLALMKKHKVKRLVVAQDRQVLGMITRSDLVRVFFDRIRSAKEN
jgi:sulfide:quinone oxidoreductase